jgi:nitrate reductase NapAB chaperone NapD
MIDDTFSQLSELLNRNSDKVSSLLATSIQTYTGALQQALLLADYVTALELVEKLIVVTENATGEQLTNVWRSSNDVVNMQGELLTRLKTLKYNLRVI